MLGLSTVFLSRWRGKVGTDFGLWAKPYRNSTPVHKRQPSHVSGECTGNHHTHQFTEANAQSRVNKSHHYLRIQQHHLSCSISLATSNHIPSGSASSGRSVSNTLPRCSGLMSTSVSSVNGGLSITIRGRQRSQHPQSTRDSHLSIS